MQYISTRGGIDRTDFLKTVTMGLGDDGGLILPEAIPDVSGSLQGWSALGYRELACEVMGLFTDMPGDDIRALIERSYSAFKSPEVTPVRRMGNCFLLELFHGPTLAFKDVALQLLGNLFEYVLDRSGGEMNVLAATSGDTGSASIHGVRGKRRIRIFVMFPKGRVSRVQELQMTSVLDSNVHCLAVNGNFDDCQAIMKETFCDVAFKKKYSLGSVNSINWARLLAQIVYYFYSAFRVMRETGAGKVRFSVPTGNFGDIFAGYVAARMGLPVDRLILATNQNDILARFFNSGVYRKGEVHATISPSMDIQIASNFERYLYYMADESPGEVRRMMAAFASDGVIDIGSNGPVDPLIVAGSADKDQTLATMKRCYEQYGVLLDPHSAVGVHAASDHIAADAPMICLATAHAAKFADAVSEAIGRAAGTHPSIDMLGSLPTRSREMPCSQLDVRDYIRTAIEGG